ncbi:TIGR03364 family FAD-dependent oxidoreductase [Kribbella speibonae]|uniref:TIGR03364 family FAD-dependent oxidoreductase n=1 Tax=Kribbella speibonae TaxID=1572660 RepID=A0A4R0J670_9ACTN|nr:TIGR03364 family FAD-dependent oxidoreductase [Kribbella speibonae]TCC18099.1 TIGR03364 family FAD-dependent oxidoreductase [Kribbella speibonae]TCC42113.1 TIGR03364 family FAD-dependent oxidoreductase [Kribbella speibonae]
MRVVVVGGGVLGTFHAWQAVRRGHEVLQVERELEARGASVRNFGLVWVSGRADGAEIELAQRARDLWAEVPGVGVRPAGSLTVCRTEAELAVAKEAAARPDAAARGFQVLDAEQTRERNPALKGDLLGALWCTRDAIVEPREVLPALRAELLKTNRYQFLGGREVRNVHAGRVVDDHGTTHAADVVVLCTGAWHSGLIRELIDDLPVRRVRLQMMQTAPLDDTLTTAVADADSFRYYPAYDGAALDELAPQDPIAADHKMQLLMVQRTHGGLTIGDTHEYDEPFGFDVQSDPYDYLQDTAEHLLGRKLPTIVRRWAGVYSQATGDEVIVRREVADGVHLVTGPGGRGMTMSPAIAEATFDAIGRIEK